MSRRTSNRDRLTASGVAAVIAAGWIYASDRQTALTQVLGPSDARAHGATLLAHPRVAQSLPNHLAGLIDLFTAHPKLAPWLSSPEAFDSLIRHVGAAISGGPMAAVVNRFEVSVLIAHLGEAVWRFGLDQAQVDENAADVDVDQIVAMIEAEGCAAVYAFLESATPALGTTAFASAGINFDAPSHVRADVSADATKSVLMVTERAAP